jgi:hypothetical protein
MRRAGRALLIAGPVLALIGVAPIAIAMLAGAIASAHGCRLDEGDVHPCRVGGQDWGPALYGFGVMAWLALVTIWLAPAGLVLFVVGLVQRLRGSAAGD